MAGGCAVVVDFGSGYGQVEFGSWLAAADGVLCKTVLGSLREPSDFAGLPVVREHGVALEAPAWAKELVCRWWWVSVFGRVDDESACCAGGDVGGGVDLTVGDVQLPKGTRVIAGANPPDCAAGGYELEAPLANRFCHVEFTPSVDEWLDGYGDGVGCTACLACGGHR